MTKLSPKIKDFIAMQMDEDDWKNILLKNLPNISQDSIKRDNNHQYDCAYAVIRKLTETKPETCDWSNMKKVLNVDNKGIVNKIENKLPSLCKGK